jgi:hypothetical protein
MGYLASLNEEACWNHSEFGEETGENEVKGRREERKALHSFPYSAWEYPLEALPPNPKGRRSLH